MRPYDIDILRQVSRSRVYLTTKYTVGYFKSYCSSFSFPPIEFTARSFLPKANAAALLAFGANLMLILEIGTFMGK